MEAPNKETKYIVGIDGDLKNYASQVNISKEEMLKASEIPKDMQGYKEVDGSLKVNGVKI